MSILRVLHLVGSATNAFYADLSRLYARECLEAVVDSMRYEFHIAYISPDNLWRFPESLSEAAIAAASAYSLPDAIGILSALNIDLALPQMFCLSGMTHYRALLDLLGIPYIGNSPEVMALVANKAKAKAVVAAAGVKVPHGEVVRSGEHPNIPPPAIVKPVNSDNSLGVSLVRNATEFSRALDTAFAHANEVLIEEFIPLGREVRGGLIIRRGQPICLPFEEYLLDAKTTPIRSYAEKLIRSDDGNLGYAAKGNGKSWIANKDDAIALAVWDAVQTCHDALGCRHYSLFDFRIDPSGQPWFLEAGLYCSFSPNSVLSEMTNALGFSLPAFFEMMLDSVC
ncbi:MAG: D-alanine--D-alanine ligase [Cyanobacteria bacterium P01_D01_bin.123]